MTNENHLPSQRAELIALERHPKYAGGRWWSAARESNQIPYPMGMMLSGGLNQVTVAEEELLPILRWAMALPSWTVLQAGMPVQPFWLSFYEEV